MKTHHLLILPALLLSISACGNSTDDDATPGGGVGIPENQGTNSGTIGDGAPDAAPAQPPVQQVQPGQPATAVGGMNYPVDGSSQ